MRPGSARGFRQGRGVPHRAAHQVILLCALLSTRCADTVVGDSGAPWLRLLGTLENRDAYSPCASLSARGEVFVASPWTGSHMLGDVTLRGDAVGTRQSYVASLSRDGAPRWTRMLRAIDPLSIRDLAADHVGGVWVVGRSATGFAIEGGVARPSGVFLLRYDGDGRVRVDLRLADAAGASPGAVVVDADDNAYVSIVMEEGAVLGVPVRSAAVASLDRDGRTRWVVPFQRAEGVYGLAPDASGGVVAAVTFRGALSVAGQTIAPAQTPGVDAAVVALSRDGALRWIRELRSAGGDYLVSIAASPSGDIAVGGRWTRDGNGATLSLGAAELTASEVGSVVVQLGPDGTPRSGRALPGQQLSALAYASDGALYYGARAERALSSADASRPLGAGDAFVARLPAQGPASVALRITSEGGWLSSLSVHDGTLLVAGGAAGILSDGTSSVGVTGISGLPSPTSTFVTRGHR